MPTATRRDRDAIALDLVGIAGLAALVVGLVVLAPSGKIGFDPGAAVSGVLGQLGVTLPAAIVMLAGSTRPAFAAAIGRPTAVRRA